MTKVLEDLRVIHVKINKILSILGLNLNLNLSEGEGPVLKFGEYRLPLHYHYSGQL